MPARPRYFAIVASMRTGSNLLERHLNQYPDLRCHGELFNPHFVGAPGQDAAFGVSRAERDRDPDRLIEAMAAAAGGRVPGFRIFDGHDERVLARVAADPACARVILARDPLESFVSLAIARETGQWLLTGTARRKSAVIAFDPVAFEAYRAALADFRARFRRAMQAAGLTAFEIGYEALKDMAVLNGLAAHLGSSCRLDRLEHTLVRQNPGRLADKVSNPEALAPYLGGGGGDAAPEPPGLPVRSLVLGRTRPLLFAPLPGGPRAAVLRWMASLEGIEAEPDAALAEGGPLRAGLSRAELDALFAAGRIAAVFTATRAPLDRAYRVFMDRIFAPGRGGFPHVREALAAAHGLVLPDPAVAATGSRAALEAAGHDLAAHRAAFAGFLRFVRLNLAGQTAVRTDAAWLPQVVCIAALRAVLPVTLVMGEAWMAKGGQLLRALAGIGEGRNALLRVPDPEGPFPLAEVRTEEHAALARAAWPEDHERLAHAWAGGG
jgi:hypothetical protein